MTKNVNKEIEKIKITLKKKHRKEVNNELINTNSPERGGKMYIKRKLCIINMAIKKTQMEDDIKSNQRKRKKGMLRMMT